MTTDVGICEQAAKKGNVPQFIVQRSGSGAD